jgi:asparagine synthase (glutamine-hydrolysing)
MCGIAGFFHQQRGPQPNAAVLRAMCDAIVHRGPDSDGMLCRDGIALGMRRLKIIDLAGGDQPIFNEDRTVAIVFNGEIYNYRELRAELERKGHRFATQSDTEVLVHLYEDVGEEMLHRLNGMFAFAIADFRARTVLLARDRLGIKPLFFTRLPQDGGTWLWGSEIKAILQYPGVPRAIDRESLGDYLGLNYLPPGRTLFAGIEQLLPGELAVLTTAGLRRKIWWDLRFTADPQWTQERAVERAIELLEDSVRMRLVSDVPFGAFLSGGIDSSAVVAMMARHMNEPVKTFSIGFGEASFDELPYARRIAQRYHTDHHELTVKPNVEELLPWLVYHSEEPTADSSAIPVLLVSKLAREHVTMVLSGDGGDELFAGYETYNAYWARKAYRLLPRMLRRGVIAPLVHALPMSSKKISFEFKARRFVEGAELPADEAHFFWRTIFTEEAKRELLADGAVAGGVGRADVAAGEATGVSGGSVGGNGGAAGRSRSGAGTTTFERWRHYFDASGSDDPLARMLYVDTRFYLPSDMLVKVDRMSMAVSLEARVPFLDYRLVEFAASVPSHVKFKGRVRKYLLKKALLPYVDRELLYRKKAGFNVPKNVWLRGALRPMALDLLAESRLRRHGLLRLPVVQRLLRDHMEMRADNSFQIWSLLIFQLWHERFIESSPVPARMPASVLA